MGNPAPCVSEPRESPSSVHVHFLASSELKSRYVIIPSDLQVWIAAMHTTDCGPVSA